MTDAATSGVPSAIVRDVLADPAAAVCDGEGRVLWCDSIRHFGELRSVAHSLVRGLEFPVEAGDVVLLNDPFSGGSRALDFYALRTVDVGAEAPPWIAVARTTIPDLGGDCFGGYNPRASEVWAEGARVTPVRAYREETGRWSLDVLACVRLNSRTPRLLESQLRALLDAAIAGSTRIPGIAKLGGGPDLLTDAVLRQGAKFARQFIGRSVNRGLQATTTMLVNDAVADGAEVRLALTEYDGSVSVDLRGSDPQTSSYANARHPTVVSACLAALFGDRQNGWIANDGVLDAVEVRTDPGTLVNAAYPRATGGARHVVGRAVAGALASIVGATSTHGTGSDSILGPDGRLDEAIADPVREDERRAEVEADGVQRWQ
jgi:N-methylhydantoinase B